MAATNRKSKQRKRKGRLQRVSPKGKYRPASKSRTKREKFGISRRKDRKRNWRKRTPDPGLASRMPPRQAIAVADDQFHQNGFFIMSDLVDFSTLDERSQKQAVKRLWTYLGNHALTAKGKAVFNGTGDGVIVAVHQKPDAGDGIYRQVMDFACGWREHMLTGERSFQMRIAVHMGPFYQVQTGVHGLQMMGTALNRCARVVNMGDAGKITVSEPFYTQWFDNDHTIGPQFQPQSGEKPLSALVKHGEQLKFRFYWPDRKEGEPLPPRVAFSYLVTNALKQELDNIEKFFNSSLLEEPPPGLVKPEEIGARVSLWGVWTEDGKTILRSTDYRHHPKKRGLARSEFTYSLDGEGEGPMGRAWHAHRPVVVLDLPSYELEQAAYEARLAQYGLSTDKIQKFNHQSRAYFALPFGLASDAFDGAICIDVEAPLTGLPESRANKIADDISLFFNLTISTLWRLRGDL